MEKDYRASLLNPVVIEIINETNINQTFRYFLCNFTETLEPNDCVKILATSSENLVYYTKIKESMVADSASGEIIINLPDPINVGDYISDDILDKQYMKGLIEKASETETGVIDVVLKQNSTILNAKLEANAENTCTIFTDEDDTMLYTIDWDDVTGEEVAIITDVNGFTDLNVFRPH